MADAQKNVHASMERLLLSARLATAKARRPITDYAGIGAALGESSATLTNWKARGVSKQGAIKAAANFHCTTAWILDGRGKPQGGERSPRTARKPEVAEATNDQLLLALSPQTRVIAERLDALSGDRRDKAHALVNAVLEPYEREEVAYTRSLDAGRRLQQAMDGLMQAESMVQLCNALDVATIAVGLKHFVALEVVEARLQFDSALHNVAVINLREIVHSDLVAGLLARPIPVPMTHALGIDEFRFGIAASAFHGQRTCLLFMGRPTEPLDDGALVEMLGSVSMFATHALESMVRLSKDRTSARSGHLRSPARRRLAG